MMLINRILSRVFVGDSEYTQKDLDDFDIMWVLNVGGKKTGMENYHRHLSDDGNNTQIDVMDAVLQARQRILCGFTVLIHCRAGMSRSPFIIAKHLESMGMDLFDAVSFVKEKHPMTQINQDLLHKEWGEK